MQLILRPSVFLVVVTLFTTSNFAHAQDVDVPLGDQDGTFTFTWENDELGGTDRNYTNGARIAWFSGTEPSDGFSDFLARKVMGADGVVKVRRGFAIGHSFFTPQDIGETAPLPDQHPYAGWLYADFTVLIDRGNVIDQLTLTGGVVGPSAGAEWLQREVHSLIDAEDALGWANQIDDEVGVVLSYDRKMRALAELGDSGFGADITPSYGIALGNVHTNAHAGLTLRVGQDLRSDYGPPRVRPALAGSGFFTPIDGLSWYIFVGAEARAVAHNIFLDGSLFRDGDPHVNSKSFVADYQGGLVTQFGSWQFALTLVERTDEFEEQTSPQRFGALSISAKF